MTDPGAEIPAEELHRAGAALHTLAEQLATDAQKLQGIMQNLVAGLAEDKSGIGEIILNTLGQGSQVADKALREIGRVVSAAGDCCDAPHSEED